MHDADTSASTIEEVAVDGDGDVTTLCPALLLAWLPPALASSEVEEAGWLDEV